MVVKANMHKQNVTMCSPKPTRIESKAAAVSGTPISQPCGVVPDSNNSRMAGLAKQSFDITPDVFCDFFGKIVVFKILCFWSKIPD